MAVPPPFSHAADKKVLRAQMRAARDAFVLEGSGAILLPAILMERLAPNQIVATYLPLTGEADPTLLARAARMAGCQLALPHVTTRTEPLRFLLWDEHAPLHAGPLGLQQPDPAGQEVAPDIILTPLVAFDAVLNRLGQGAGHYDRAFVRYPHAWRLGVAWSIQQVDMLPADPWDVPLHAIVTETGVLTGAGA